MPRRHLRKPNWSALEVEAPCSRNDRGTVNDLPVLFRRRIVEREPSDCADGSSSPAGSPVSFYGT